MSAARAALAALSVLCFLPPLHAEVMIQEVSWQLASPGPGRKAVYQAIKELPTQPPRIEGKLRLRVVLKNRGPHEADGLVLRYCLTARLAATGGNSEGVWAVPFLISEKRVPKVGPNQHLEVALDPAMSVDMPLTHYLQRALNSGFWPDQLRLQVMLAPRRGVVETIQTQELVIPVKRI